MNTALIEKINQYITDNGNGLITGPVLNKVLRDMVMQSVANITYATLVQMSIDKHISPGTVYKITDRGDRGIFIMGLTDKALAREGMRIMLCPKTYKTETLDENSWKGVWHANKTASTDDLFIWGARVWKNITGSIGEPVSDFELDDTNWILIDKASFLNNEYVEVVMPISYDFVNDWIERQSLPGQLEAGIPWTFGQMMDINFLDVNDWNDNSTIMTNVESQFGVINNVECGKFVNVKSFAIMGNYQTAITDVYAAGYTYSDDSDISGVIVRNHCTSISNINKTGSIIGIPHADLWYADHTDDESLYFQYNFTENSSDEHPTGPVTAGNFIYLNMILAQDVLLTEMVAVGVGLTGEAGAKLSIGLEIDDETYIQEATLANLNNGVKISTLGNKTTARYRRFKISAVNGDVNGGLLKIFCRYL